MDIQDANAATRLMCLLSNGRAHAVRVVLG